MQKYSPLEKKFRAALERVMICIALILVCSEYQGKVASKSYQQSPTKKSSAPKIEKRRRSMSADVASNVLPFNGAWYWKFNEHEESEAYPNGDFLLTIHQKGDALKGSMTGTAFGGNRVSVANFTGTANGNKATIEWRFEDGGEENQPADGTATLELVGKKIIWNLEYHGKKESWFPTRVTLRRKLMFKK